MAGLSSWRNLLSMISEVDLRPIRAEAERFVDIAIVSENLDAAHHLAEQLCRDPDRPGEETQAPLLVTTQQKLSPADHFDLVFLILDRAGLEDLYQSDLLNTWRTTDQRVVIILQENLAAAPESDAESSLVVPKAGGRMARVLGGSVYDLAFLQKELIPAALAIMPEYMLSLARNFPLFRTVVARRLINETCNSNAAYSLTTGLAEIIPVLNIPLNVADMIVLTKAQAFLVYRLGLALGMPYEWRSYLVEFGGVLGGGFFWRQIGRLLIGLVPGFGIIPKVGVSYAGTFVVGQVVYHWYLTGRQISGERMRGIYRQALENGKLLAARLISFRFRLPRRPRKPDKQLSAGAPVPTKKGRRFSLRRKKTAKSAPQLRLCPVCGSSSAADAQFCQYCGAPLNVSNVPPAST